MDDNKGTGKGLILFLDFVAQKGMMPSSMAGALRGAVKEVMAAVDGSEWEAADVTSLDVEDYTSRYGVLQRMKYKPSTLTAYKQRFKLAVTAYRSFLNDSNWRYTPERPAALRKKPAAPQRHSAALDGGAPPPPKTAGDAVIDYPFPLRPGLIVHLGLPADLTRQEATRLAGFMGSLSVEPIRLLGSGRPNPEEDTNAGDELPTANSSAR